LQVGGQVLVFHVHARNLRRAGDDRGLSAGIEPRSDLAELPAEGAGEVVDLEADRGMDRVERPGPHRHRLPGVCRNAHVHSSLSQLYLSTQSIYRVQIVLSSFSQTTSYRDVYCVGV